MPSAAGKKHDRDDGPSTPTLASTSKKRVRFANGVIDKKRVQPESDGEDSDATITATPKEPVIKKQRIGGMSVRSLFRKFVVNALDERAIVSVSFPPCQRWQC
jgi:hypothetical protein